ncbi:MAG: lysophospholipase [Chloroflexota bacterium]
MEHSEGRFQGLTDTSLYYQCWLPRGVPRAVLVVIHGLAEHSGRYMNLVNYFVPKDYAIYGYDHRGHGKSEGPRCYVKRFSEYVDDLGTFLDLVYKNHQQKKPYLIGHSMGATIAIAHAVEHQDDLAGLMLSGTLIKPGSSVPPVLAAIVGILSVLMPKMGTTVLDASAISRDKTVVNAYVNDPLVNRSKIPARLGAELLKTIRELPPDLPRITLPVLLMHGTADRLAAPEGSQTTYELLGTRNKTLLRYQGFYHEIFNEPEREQVFKDMEVWLANNHPDLTRS